MLEYTILLSQITPREEVKIMKSTETIQPSDPPKNAILAAILSFLLFGGVGQLYLGQTKKGIILIVAFFLGSCTFGIVTAIAWIVGIIDAYIIGDKLAKGESVGDMQWFWES
jgi:TM2 domain-containing membrane protein YozV